MTERADTECPDCGETDRITGGTECPNCGHVFPQPPADYGAPRPRLLDLFCGAGGTGMGYHRAGFDVVGVDIKPQKNYPFEFHQADALTFDLGGFDAIHASPPCQAHSVAKNIRQGHTEHPDLVWATRARLVRTGVPWIIENVPGSPLLNPITLCGLAFGLNVKRHRLFEASFLLMGAPPCPKGHPGNWVTVFGGGAPAVPDNRRRAPADVARAAMGIDWMTRTELSQSIPPAYTEWVGAQLLAVLATGEATEQEAVA